jgi:N-acyl amino acid synthase of PEP-CTERM/exosortase system
MLKELGDYSVAGSAPQQKGSDLVDLYEKFFRVEEATTPELKDLAYRIRYQVYCVENPFEDPTDNLGGLETDRYDDRSATSVLFHRPTGLAAGTVRIVLSNPTNPQCSFALQDVCRDPAIRREDRFPVRMTGEISRFCVTKDFRRRVEDMPLKYLPANGVIDEAEWRRVIPNMTLGLIEWLVRFSVRQGLTHWCAVMEPRLLRLLARLGIYFEPIGGLVEYHGKRQPCFAELTSLLDRVERERPDVWDVIAARGRHRDALREKDVI